MVKTKWCSFARLHTYTTWSCPHLSFRVQWCSFALAAKKNHIPWSWNTVPIMGLGLIIYHEDVILLKDSFDKW